MRNIMKKGFLCLAIGFLALFAFRFAYGYLSQSSRALISNVQDSLSPLDIDFSRKNYASEKMKVERNAENPAYSVDQKYEKIASMHSRTEAFDEDEKRIRGFAEKYNALIQFEQNTGLKGTRRLNLA